MREKIKAEYFDPGFILSSAAAWLIAASVLTVICSVLLYETNCNEKIMGFVSSAVSFVSAAAAGRAAGMKRKRNYFYTALMTAAFIVTALLTIGFMIDGSDIEPSAIMSVISFTFAGCLLGAASCSNPGNKKKYRPEL